MKKISHIKIVLTFLYAAFCVAGCGDGSSSSGVGTLKVINSTGQTIKYNYRFAVPPDWKKNGIWFYCSDTQASTPLPISAYSNDTSRTSAGMYDLQIGIGNGPIVDYYDKFRIDDMKTTSVEVKADGTLVIRNNLPYE